MFARECGRMELLFNGTGFQFEKMNKVLETHDGNACIRKNIVNAIKLYTLKW